MESRATQPDGGVAVVIVNFRTKVLTADAVLSVLGESVVQEVVVVDNDSGDGSAEFLRTAFANERVRLIESPSNVGFGRGVNLGVSHSCAPYVFLLNSDAVVRPEALAALRAALDADPGIGVVAPAVYLADGHSLQPDAHGPLPAPRAVLRTNPVKGAALDPGERAPGWVSGVAMMLRRVDFDTLGGFDSDFTMYLEDVDLCRRVRASGRRVAREPSAAVVHLGGRSTSARGARLRQFHDSKAVYLRKAGAGPVQRGLAALLRVARIGMEQLRPGPPDS